ncbi:ParB/RepB/Spo0J family partition protein [Photobacterium leiognathi]|uniref:ParB/RepB/Spo0J family partition protein n=1 Tax=Photobacterium leiognathi TaxID=553611 RepID=UPI001EDF3FEF|nr:ParB/RepB/Spo0J family partition protein [Photobacterium leiognathi]MCG3885109.1 ParB/RepB/Spo0J family partition protein [Photobacterium leiognathi]
MKSTAPYPIYPSQIKQFKILAKIFSTLIEKDTAIKLSSFNKNDWISQAIGYKGHSDLTQKVKFRSDADKNENLYIFSNCHYEIISKFSSKLPNVPSSVISSAIRKVASIEKRATYTKIEHELYRVELPRYMTRKVMGKDVTFSLIKIHCDKIHYTYAFRYYDKEQYWSLNEPADQELINSFEKDGQRYPVYGRRNSGFEIANGNRRRKAAYQTRQPLLMWEAELNDDQMQYLANEGNQDRETSAFERGYRYKDMLFTMTEEEVSKSIGLSIQEIKQYVATANLPIEFIRQFTAANEVSAQQGEILYKLYKNLNKSQKIAIADYYYGYSSPLWKLRFGFITKEYCTTEKIIELFMKQCRTRDIEQVS